MRRLAVAALGAVLAGGVGAQAAVPATSVAQAVKRSIQIGGDLKQWEGLTRYPVTLSNGVPSVPVKYAGSFSLAYDDRNLYVLGEFDQPAGTVLATLPSEAAEWWKDDVLELYLRPQPFAPAPAELHLATNPAGTRFKAYTATTEYRSAGRVNGDKWVLELALPLNTATFPAARAGDVWGLKVGREHQQAAEFPLWPVGGDFGSPGNYGYLAFTEQPADAATLARSVTERLGTAPAGAPIASRLSDIGSYAVYYGKAAGDVAKLSNYDLAIVQPSTLTAAQLKALHAEGTRVAAYLTIGELDPNSPQAAQVRPEWVLGENRNWGSKFIDASQPGWQALVAAQAAELMRQGYDGLFLDTLDTADLYPQAGPGLVKIVQNLRSQFPDALLVQNRGFGLLNQTAPSLDAVMYESFSSSYDFGTKAYASTSGDPGFVQALAGRGLVVLALDYAQPAQTDVITRDYERARSFGFIPFVSTINLDELVEANP